MNLAKNAVNRRSILMVFATFVLAGCSVIPKTPTTSTQNPVATPTQQPTATGLPADETRHRVALLVPMTGENGKVGIAIANATTMALLDTNASDLRITTYNTATGAREAGRKAVADGNRLILGPLLAEDVPAVLAEARAANVPLISYSNDIGVAGPDVFVMGHVPDQSIARTVAYARSKGSRNFAIIAPEGEYGERASVALVKAVAASGGALVRNERYSRGNTSIVSAAQRLKNAGGFDTVLIADSARLAALAAGELRPRGVGTAQLLGTELLSGESSVTRVSALQGSWFSAVSDARFKRFADSYSARFGEQPFRIATLGYDSVLLTLRVAREWKVGSSFPVGKLRASDGFLGLDGAFRFAPNGVIDRAMEVREVRDGEVVIIDAAPSKFED